MGSHVWVEQCPYCGFEEMLVSTYNSFNFEVTCQICGYARWTEERVPDNHDVEIAKQELNKMDDKEKKMAMELYYKDSVTLVDRLKGNF